MASLDDQDGSNPYDYGDDRPQDDDEGHDGLPSSQQYETYKKIKILGKGSFGKAFLVECGSDQVSKAKNHCAPCVESCSDKEDQHQEDERGREEGDLPRGKDPRSTQSS